MSLRKECGYGKQPLSDQIFHSVMNQFDHFKRKSTPKITAHKTQCIPNLFLDKNNLTRMNEAESQDNLVKLAHLYEISRAIHTARSIDEMCQQIVKNLSLAWHQCEYIFPFIEIYDKCFKSDNFTHALTHKFSAPIIVNDRTCGQVCFFYEDISLIKWSDNEDAIFLQNIANDIGLWLEQKQRYDVQAVLLNEVQVIESATNEHVSIAITDMSGKINYVNEKFCTISKYSAEELLGQDHRIINSGFHSKEFMCVLWDTIMAGEIWKGGFKNRTREGAFYWIDATIIPLLDRTGSPYQYVALWTDVTGYKQLEEKMEGQVKELARSNDELEQFAYVVTHDLQEPLRAINSFVQLLKKYCHHQLDERANELVSHAVAGTSRMQMLIDDLLTYAQVDANQTLTEVDCEKLLSNVLADLSVIVSECNAVITHDRLPVVRGIPFQFIQLLTNLINNALKFQRAQPPKIHIGVEESFGEWILSVTDNGIGIEEQYLERIFRVFQRLHSRREYAGTGIGLAICKKVVEYHGGRIWIQSEPDVGSTVYFTIPKFN